MGPSLAAFITQYLHRGPVGTNDANNGQCVGLVMKWFQAKGLPTFYGNADQLLDNALSTLYHRVNNGPVNYPPPGAVVCWDSTWGGGFGHTAIVVAANPVALVVFEQNDPIGGMPTVATHGYQGVQGWLMSSADAALSHTPGAEPGMGVRQY